MGCNTSKDSSVSQNENENKENTNEEGNKQIGEENHVQSDQSERNTKSSSAKTITIRSNGTANPNSETTASSEQPSEEEAATKIQAVFRGHKTRKSMKQPQAQQEQNKEPTREELENEFREDDKELCNAATKIQASFRGHMSRKQEEDKKTEGSSSKEEELDIDLTDPELNKAACKIQASFRGHLNRKDPEEEGKSSN